MTDPASPRVSRLAVAALLLGVLSPLLWALAGVPAMVLGLQGLRAVNASEGRLRGRGLAVTGMVLGALFTTLSAAGALLLILLQVNEKSRQTECADNFRQIGRAVGLAYDHNGKRFPRAALPNPALRPEQRLSWFTGLLPYLDQQKDGTGRWQPLAARIDLRQGWDDPANKSVLSTNIFRFLCPAHPGLDPHATPGLTDYVGMTGIGADSALLPRDDPRAGFFGYEREISEKDLGGGLTFTMVATETTLHNGPWLAAGDPTLRGLDRQETPYVGPGRQFGGCHAKGLNVLFADGSCRFYNASVEPLAFEQLIPLVRDEP
jgi:prepilin-type processing-associated H-X9-DG protein